MNRRVGCLLLVLGAGGMCSANVYTVKTKSDTGNGSLRWAIEQANSHPGGDKIVTSGAISNATIWLATALPPVTDAYTIISGDTDGQALPNLRLAGSKVPRVADIHGLVIRADHCEVWGLCITGFYANGIRLESANHCRIAGCHVGANLAGTAVAPNSTAEGFGEIYLIRSDDNMIGGLTARERNVIGAGHNAQVVQMGLRIANGSRNAVVGNHIGVNFAGSAVLGNGDTGVFISANEAGEADGNEIGGTMAGAGNVIGGILGDGVYLSGAVTHTRVQGNLLGVAREGAGVGVLPIGGSCVALYRGCNQCPKPSDTLIGGTTAAARNVFAGGAEHGVYIDGAGAGNQIQGNYFGTDATGTTEEELQTGVELRGDDGTETTIGGARTSARNYFAPSGGPGAVGVRVHWGVGSTVIRRNHFGVLPDGTGAGGMVAGVVAWDSSPVLRDNVIANAWWAGLYAEGEGANPAVYGNTFRNCDRAVWLLDDAHCRLGNLGNANADDDGGNRFRPSNALFIYNGTPNTIRAEGNEFGTTERPQIDAKIHDRLDNASLGLVDYDPLAGGVSPTALGGPLMLTGATSLATRTGVEIAFTLSRPARVTVEVLNVAGRPVATAARHAAFPAGLNRVAWNGRASSGTLAPPGQYVIRVLARDAAGSQTSALCAALVR